MLEYLAAGRPVISNVQGDAAVLLGQSGGGTTVEAGRSEALASAVLKLRSEPVLREEMARRGRLFVEQNSSWNERALRYEEVFEGLIRRHYAAGRPA
jgi:glycosyltransferase involved in cell wall biosynthesis